MSNCIPKISIGLAVYNGEKYLSETIQSFLDQTFIDFELIISDNASSDATETICREFVKKDPRVRYERQTTNRGAPWNFNRVFEISRGQYFKWAAHDDLCAKTYLSRCVEVLERNSDVVWVQSRVGVIDGVGRPLDTDGCVVSDAAEDLPAYQDGTAPILPPSPLAGSPHVRFRRLLLGNSSLFDCYGLIRRDVLKNTPLWKPYFGSEKVLLGSLALRGRCAQIQEPLFYFRIHPDACTAHGTLEEEMAWCNPNMKKPMPNALIRIHLLFGHCNAILKAPIGLRSQFLCLVGIFSYLFQFQKWKSVVAKIFRNSGMGGGTKNVLRDSVVTNSEEHLRKQNQLGAS